MDKHLTQPIAKIYTSGIHSGRSKPRLRLLSMLPSHGNSSILPDYNTISKLNDQPKISEHVLLNQNAHLDSDQQQYSQLECTTRNPKPSRLSRFVKRFSMTFVPNNVSVEKSQDDDIDQTEDKQNSTNRFDFNHWRRRKSLSRSKYNQSERDRSPLCRMHFNGDDTSKSIDPTLKEQHQQPIVQSSNAQTSNSPLIKLVSKRRTSLSRWFPHSVKTPRNSVKLTSTPSVSSPTKRILTKRYSDNLSNMDDINQTIIDSVSLTTKKIKKSDYSCDDQLVSSHQDTMSEQSKLGSQMAIFNSSVETMFKIQSCNSKSGLADFPAKFSESSLVNGSMLSSSFSDSQSSFDFNEPKPWFANPVNGLDGSICQQRCSSSGTSIFSDWETENMDPAPVRTLKMVASESIDFLNRDTRLQTKPITNGSTDLINNLSIDQNYLSQNSRQGLSKSSKKLAELCATQFSPNDTKLAWTNRLQKPVNRINRKRILMAGTTVFNRNPSEGINYLIKHGIVVYHPISIARFLFSDHHLNRQAIGEYFGQISDVMAAKVLKEFLGFINMKGLEVDEALRSVLSYFHPSGESQKIAFLMQLFQEVYVAQNPDRVQKQFRSAATVEVLAYSVLLLHTDLHNPNVRRLGKRMTQSDFIMNNRGIDSDQDIEPSILEGIYKRIAETQFKTLPDPSDPMRVLDNILTGHLKTDNFVQRHRRFVGWAFVQQLDKIISRRPSNRSHTHWRYVFTFNDILIIARPTNMARIRPDHVLNKAAQAAVADIGSLRLASSRLSTERRPNRLDSSSLTSGSSEQLYEISRKVNQSNEPCSDLGPCHVKVVLPLLDLRVLVFETQRYRYGVQLCSSNGPLASFNMLSYQARQQFVNWLHESIAEMQELQIHQKQLEIERINKLAQVTLKNNPE